MLELTKAQYAVFSIGSHRGNDSSLNPDVQGYRPIFEKLHTEKISISQAIVVINVEGYVGDHTKAEINYARQLGKRIFWYDLTPYLEDRGAEGKYLKPGRYGTCFMPGDQSWMGLLKAEA